MEPDDIESPDSPEQSFQQRFRTKSVCIKMKFDALKENVVTEEKNFIVVHEMYQCSKCYKIFNEESALTDHDCTLRKQIKSTSQVKNISATMLASKSVLPGNKKKYNYDCDQCNLSFTQKKMLKRHQRQAHKTKRIKELQCAPCNLTFADRNSLLEHRRSHYREKWFQCDQCSKRFSYEKLLDWHVRRVHLAPPPKPIHQCDICDKIYSTRHNLARHRALHKLSKQFACEICNASFPLKAYLQNHLLSHSEERPFMCEKCGKTYKSKPSLTKHSYSHERKASQPRQGGSRKYAPHLYKYVCDKCGRRFYSRYTLKNHYFIHTGEMPHKCEICSKAFRYKLLLKTHLTIHSDIRFTCDVCSRAFRTEEFLKKHQFVHSDIRFTCDVCGRQYANPAAYKKHLKLHNEDEALPCDSCDMKFDSKSALITHSVVHTKEKPYECEVCHKRYSQKGSLNKHPCSRDAAKSTAEILLNLISRNDNS